MISSTNNPTYRELLKIRAQGRRCGFVLLEGERIHRELQARGFQFQTIGCEGGEERDLMLEDSLFRTLCQTESPQKILLKVPVKQDQSLGEGPYLILDRIQDPGNLGTLLRSAQAFGLQDIILLKGTVSPWNNKVLRSSLGAFLSLRVKEEVRPEELREMIPEVLFLAAHMEGIDFQSYRPEKKWALILGSEAHGLDPALQVLVSDFLCIPMPGAMESLNVAVAGSILLQSLCHR